jgi:hypothetical protein
MDMRGYRAALRAEGLVHIQSLGNVPGKLVKDLEPGDILLRNYGYAYKVLGKQAVSGKFMEVSYANLETGEIFHERMGKDRLVAVRRRHPEHARTR